MTTTVAYLGPEGTFTHEAARNLVSKGTFGAGEITLSGCASAAAAIGAVSAGEAQAAVVAIENSVDGPVTPTFDALADTLGVRIIAETDLEISFAMMVRPGFDPAGATTIATHPVAYRQVVGWLDSHMPGLNFIAASSNGQAASMVAHGKADVAAAPRRAADLCGLDVIADHVADVPGARTRFVAVAPAATPPARTGRDRTAIMFTLKNRPGSLVEALTQLSIRGVDLSSIESRPTRTGLGTYRFHADIVGHIDDEPVAQALMALHGACTNLRYLGSWPACGDRFAGCNPDARAELAAARAWLAAAQAGTDPS